MHALWITLITIASIVVAAAMFLAFWHLRIAIAEDNCRRAFVEAGIDPNFNFGDATREAHWGGTEPPPTRWAWHIHHAGMPNENITKSVNERIDYMKETKLIWELPRRLNRMRPVLSKQIPTTESGWIDLHEDECRNCQWTPLHRSLFNKDNNLY